MIKPNPRERTQTFLPPMIVSFSTFSGVVSTKNICGVFGEKRLKAKCVGELSFKDIARRYMQLNSIKMKRFSTLLFG